MDSLGKVFDVFILLVIMFIFPVNWAMMRAEQASDFSVKQIADEFLDTVMNTAEINNSDIERLEENLRSLFGSYKVGLTVKRMVSEAENMMDGRKTYSFESEILTDTIMGALMNRESFKLYRNDILVIKISDKEGTLYGGARLIL